MTQAPFYLDEITANSQVYAEFIGRITGVPVDTDREATVARLTPSHRKLVEDAGFKWEQLHRAEQVHGSDITIVKKGDTAQTWPLVDGLITAELDVLLGIYTADCGAVYISDSEKRVIALLHSGKKGTDGNITEKAIQIMVEDFGCKPADLIVALAPCIRPPAYEVDFAQTIREQAIAAGVLEGNFTDSDICTSHHVDDYYSYRAEKGSTGRMLALLGMRR
ncbi:polyphenol oxidase family protein [Akkermansiaceae bacterium]|nr:polyphenol oxidase family protein [Akkermansiaceae bacterium]